jgi:hypothetical protein
VLQLARACMQIHKYESGHLASGRRRLNFVSRARINAIVAFTSIPSCVCALSCGRGCIWAYAADVMFEEARVEKLSQGKSVQTGGVIKVFSV